MIGTPTRMRRHPASMAGALLAASAVHLHRTHAAFELDHVDGGRKVRVATAVFGAFERFFQQ
jgi:hypothetical protein